MAYKSLAEVPFLTVKAQRMAEDLISRVGEKEVLAALAPMPADHKQAGWVSVDTMFELACKLVTPETTAQIEGAAMERAPDPDAVEDIDRLTDRYVKA